MKKILAAMVMAACALGMGAETNYQILRACHPDDVKHYDTDQLRSHFLMTKVMEPDVINLTYTLYDRLIYGGVIPVNKTVELETIDPLKAEYFLQRRALGVINQLIVNNVLEEGPCELQMGLTELQTGSVWNTMPAHTHDRRVEAYYYFNVPEGNRICHIMGEPQENRLIWMDSEQAVISPEWSVHCACGTSNYMFIWGMGGENLDYGDMDKVAVPDMR